MKNEFVNLQVCVCVRACACARARAYVCCASVRARACVCGKMEALDRSVLKKRDISPHLLIKYNTSLIKYNTSLIKYNTSHHSHIVAVYDTVHKFIFAFFFLNIRSETHFLTDFPIL